MGKQIRLLVLGIALCNALLWGGEAASAPAFSAREFTHWFRDGLVSKLVVPAEARQALMRCEFVFIAGYNSERNPRYFGTSIEQLQKLGVPESSIHLVKPDSTRSFEANHAEVREVMVSAAKSGRKRVVIGHSRGAEDAMLFALRNPKFIRDHVLGLFLLQGSFGGSGLADYLLGNGPRPDGRMPASTRWIARGVGLMQAWRHRKAKAAGSLAELTRSWANEFWRKELAVHSDSVSILAEKTFFVRSYLKPEEQRMLHWVTGHYLAAYFGINDGVVALCDQYLRGIGEWMATLQAGHADLTQESPKSRRSSIYRRALVDAIAMSVWRAVQAETVSSTAVTLSSVGTRPSSVLPKSSVGR